MVKITQVLEVLREDMFKFVISQFALSCEKSSYETSGSTSGVGLGRAASRID